MKKMIILGSFISAASALAADKPRFPASLECPSKTTQALQDLVYQLNLDNTVKQSRYAKMMNSLGAASDCEVANEIMISTIKDCTQKSLKKTNCK